MPTQQFFPAPDGRKIYAKIRVADGAILSRLAHWPAFPDDAPIVGDDGTTQYLPVQHDDDPVEYDSDLFSLQTTEVVGPTIFHLKKELIKRSKDELKTRAKNYEALHRTEWVPPTDLSALTIIGLAIVLKYAKGITPTPEEAIYVDAIVAAAAPLEANNTHLAQINAQIDADQEPDLKTGWQKKP